MPVYRPRNVEHATTSGRVYVMLDDGHYFPAYWSHPDTAGDFPGICLIHDWWGITATERRLGNLFAQMGYYVVVPDLFDGKTASSAYQAIALVKALGDKAIGYIDKTLVSLENHSRCNGNVAAVGLGMGGSLAFKASLMRPDLEAAVAYYGLPHSYIGRFARAKAPILAFYGSHEPHVPADMIERMKRELANSPLMHDVVILDGAARGFFDGPPVLDPNQPGTIAWETTLNFLDKHLFGKPKKAETTA
ncbi:MAG: hypothetical protein HC828_22030 [Blastochloris sp.]|nr:hypothetical protein [Blastochloris sp.]